MAGVAVGVFFYLEKPWTNKESKIVVGGLFDLSGPNAAKSTPYAHGMIDATRWINADGGINGRKIDLLTDDYGHDTSRALKIYQDYIDGGVELIQGWGREVAENLASVVSRDSVIFMSSAHAANLCDPFYTPYNFQVATDEATAIRLAVKYIHNYHSKAGQPLKMVFIYPDSAQGRAPIMAGKKMAAALGIHYGEDEVVASDAGTAIGQLNRVKAYAPDWIWLGGDLDANAVIVKDAAKIRLDAKFIVNPGGFDESFAKKAGTYADGRVYGILACAMFGDDVPGMRAIVDSHARYRAPARGSTLYVRGWLSMLVLADAIQRAGPVVNGPSVRSAMEALRDNDFGRLAAPISFFVRDHRPNSGMRIYRIDNGVFVPAAAVGLNRDPRHMG
jgi:branched-chain amino acid transport system substrate-binding protein